MKIKTNKFLLGTLFSAISLCVVGSVASTYAWYTYNTKDTFGFHGQAVGRTANLQLKLNSEDDTKWRTTLTSAELVADSIANGHAGNQLSPITTTNGFQKVQALNPSTDFYGAPSYLKTTFTHAGVKDDDNHDVFFQTSINFRCVDPSQIDTFLSKDVYISFIGLKMRTIKDNPETSSTEDSESTSEEPEYKDISEGLRLHIGTGDTGYMIAPGKVESGNIDLFGELDLNGDGLPDAGVKDGDNYREYIPGFDDPEDLEVVKYGIDGKKQYYAGKTETVATFSEGKKTGNGIKICSTGTIATSYPTVTFTFFLEGWEPSIIDENYRAEFDFAIQFECEI